MLLRPLLALLLLGAAARAFLVPPPQAPGLQRPVRNPQPTSRHRSRFQPPGRHMIGARLPLPLPLRLRGALEDGAEQEEEESTTELGKLLDKDPKEKGACAPLSLSLSLCAYIGM